MFQAALDQNRNPIQRAEILEELWRKCEARVSKTPEGYAGGYVQTYMRVSKNK